MLILSTILEGVSGGSQKRTLIKLVKNGKYGSENLKKLTVVNIDKRTHGNISM